MKPIRYSSGADDRITCRTCANLSGYVCRAANPGGVVSAVVGHRPSLPDLTHRCKGFYEIGVRQ